MMRPIHPPLIALVTLVILLPGPRRATANVNVNENDDANSALIGRWKFTPENRQGRTVQDLSGENPAKMSGAADIASDATPPHVRLAGTDGRVVVSEALTGVRLPTRAITVTGWVSVDRPLEWGGIAGVIQDNGQFERGWLLGYRGSRFCFAVATEGQKRLTYLTGATDFEPDHWFHVAGTYDSETRTQQLFVNGELESTATDQSGAILYPPSAVYEIGAYHDDDEFYRMTGGIHEIRVYDRALSGDEIRDEFSEASHQFPAPPPAPIHLDIAYGPFVDWVDRTTVRMVWQVDEPMPARVEMTAPGTSPRVIEDSTIGRRHELVIEGIQPDREYQYRIHGPDQADAPGFYSKLYEFDSSFFYREATPPKRVSPFPADDLTAIYERAARDIIKETGITQGYCLIVGVGEGRLARELAIRTRLKIVGIDPDRSRVNAARRALDKAGLYGVRATIHHGEFSQLPYGPYFANLIVSDSMLSTGRIPAVAAGDLYRVLRPSGGVLWLTHPGAEARESGTESALRSWFETTGAETLEPLIIGTHGDSGVRGVLRRGALPGSGEWTHQYGGADNSSCSQDELVQGDLSVLWWGDPGPRPMPDRGNRNPAPLYADGRMYVQGNRVLFGLDAYNGSILWTMSAPEVRRANLPRDCSNMTAADDFLYVVQGRYCVGINGDRGTRDRLFQAPDHSALEPHDWGYVSVAGDQLIGSSIKPDSVYLGDDGEWFEGFGVNEISRVTSVSLFGLDLDTGEPRWRYQGGTVINSTITIGDGVIYFLESRNPAAAQTGSSQVPIELLTDQHLVALDLNTGRTLWESEQDLSACQFMTYMVYANDTLVVTGTDKEKIFHTFAFNTRVKSRAPGVEQPSFDLAGTLLWNESHKEDKGHHSGHLQHPVVIGDTFYSDQRAFELRSGKLIRKDLPERRGCGTMSAAKNSVFFRHYFHGMWDLKSDRRTQFEGIRSGCWLSLIPAGGLLLAPETSAGCSCTHAIQTSVAYVPK